MEVCNAYRDYFLITVLFVFFLLLYVIFHKEESFSQQIYDSPKFSPNEEPVAPVFMKPSDMQVYQGVSIPTKYKPTYTDYNDPSMPSVDGNENGLRSMYMFSYNQCKPECCMESPYSCSGGCVCTTPDQLMHLRNRGGTNMIGDVS